MSDTKHTEQSEREKLIQAIKTLAIAQKVKGNLTSEDVLVRAAAMLAEDKAGMEAVGGVVLQYSLGDWRPALVSDPDWHVTNRGAKRLYTTRQPQAKK